jgi:hypothetical protein
MSQETQFIIYVLDPLATDKDRLQITLRPLVFPVDGKENLVVFNGDLTHALKSARNLIFKNFGVKQKVAGVPQYFLSTFVEDSVRPLRYWPTGPLTPIFPHSEEE